MAWSTCRDRSGRRSTASGDSDELVRETSVAPTAVSSYYHRTAVHILVVEDEEKVARALQEGLAAEGYEVTLAATGEDGFFRASAENFDLVILDLMLPGRDGLRSCPRCGSVVSRRPCWF